jgi:uncharacterized protein (DUF2267 family)
MKYRELIYRLKDSAGTENASEETLELVVENVAAHLSAPMRREFAAALPAELHNAASMVPTATHIDTDIIEQLMDIEDLEESQARRRIRAAWQAIKDVFDSSEVEDIRAELPHKMVVVLE